MIKVFSSSFKVGVNGYGFAINNNGFVLFHPDLDKKVITCFGFTCFIWKCSRFSGALQNDLRLCHRKQGSR